MEGLENLNDELKKYIVINEYGLPNIEYPYYQFNVYYPIERHINEINDLFLRQKTYIDLLKEHDENIKFEVNENFNGEISIRHNEFIEINDIENYSIDEINDFFNENKKNIDWVKNINNDLRKSIIKEKNGIISILHNSFELNDVLKYSPTEVNEKFSNHIIKQKDLLENKKYEKYILSLPQSKRLYEFNKLTKKPKLGSILYYETNGKELWELEDNKYWDFLRSLWNSSDKGIGFINGFDFYELVKNRKSGIEFFMTYDERIEFEKLPDEITIYRGYVDRHNPKEISYSHQNESEFVKKRNEIQKNSIRRILNNGGFSFTLSKTIGLKYVEKYKQYNRIDEYGYVCESKLFEITIPKKYVLGLLNHNQEEEIVIVLDNLSYY